QVDEQPMLPEKKNGSHMFFRSPDTGTIPQTDGMPSAARTSEMLASPPGDLSAPSRARMGSMLQRQVGNERVGRTLGTTVQTKLTIGAPDDVHEQEADQVAGEVGKTSSATRIQRQPATGSVPAVPAPAPTSDLALTPQDEIITASLLQTLENFKNIPIFVGLRPQPPGPPQPVTVKVHAQYFNNKFNEDPRYKDLQTARKKKSFRKIIKALDKPIAASVLKGKTKPLSAGRAVEVGKASPADIKVFVEKAIAEKVIDEYARKIGKLEDGQMLINLPDADLQEVIQGWMQRTGVGLDCNGFVQQALIQMREDERAVISVINSITGVFGLPALSLPAEIEHKIKAVGSFKTKETVKIPTKLRPGDVWVMSDEGHIRIVTDVRMSPDGKTIVFDTAESTLSSGLDPGPVARTWQTGSLTSFKPITRNGHKADEGTFHHIPPSESLTSKKAKKGRTSHRSR
ncbi:MAG TPA: hypothetical protein VFY26_15645, partial [Anaerolineales bacterium]|nr:hypothetical protein [Anaerolineales bacterium]